MPWCDHGHGDSIAHVYLFQTWYGTKYVHMLLCLHVWLLPVVNLAST